MADQSSDLYPQMGGAKEMPAAEMDTGETNSEDTGGETALLPKSILAGKEFRPGEEVVLKIVRVHDDEVEVSYATEHDESKENEEGESAESEIDRMSMMGNPKKGY